VCVATNRVIVPNCTHFFWSSAHNKFDSIYIYTTERTIYRERHIPFTMQLIVLLRTTLCFLVVWTPPPSRAFLFNLFSSRNRNPGRVTGMQLVQAPTGALVSDLVNGTIVYLGTIAAVAAAASSPPTLTVVAVTDTTSKRRIKSLVFDWNTKLRYRTETTAPYTLCGGKSYAMCTELRAGVHTVTATPYGGASYRVTFTLVDGNPPTPTSAPLQTKGPTKSSSTKAPVKVNAPVNVLTTAPVAIVPTPTSSPPTSPPRTQPAIYINCGGGSYIDAERNKWDADVYFSGGAPVTFPIVDIDNTANDELYLTHREVLSNTTPTFIRYDIPVMNGLYEIQLHFAETRYVCHARVLGP
jgi:Malectin domain